MSGARALELLRAAAPWLTGAWLLGVVLFLLRFSGQALYVYRFCAHHQTPADAHWQACAHALAARLGVRRTWQLMQSGRAESPLTLGVLRPLIVLPTSALTGMPAAQLETLLAHELAHIKRHDYLVNLFQCVAEALLFYHPAVWWVSGTVRRAREECCDDLAVEVCGDAKLYARALTNLEALRQPPALALAATDKPLLGRVRRLLGLGEARAFPPTATAVLLVLMLALGTGLGVSGETTVQKAPIASPAAPEAPKQGSLIKGVVVWNDERLANIKVELQEEPEENDSGAWNNPPVLQTTKTNAQGEYRFENVPPGNYVVWALGDEKGYQTVGYGAAAYAETSGTETIRLDKLIEVIGPVGTTIKTLTPTLRWKPVPDAARYEVSLKVISPSEDSMTAHLYRRTDETKLDISEPLERATLYGWSVTAYTEDGTQIASIYESVFSTNRSSTPRPVRLRDVGISTVLFTDWRQTSPGVFEYVDAAGGKSSLTFERRPRADLDGLESNAITLSEELLRRYTERDWEGFALNGSVKLVTVEGDSAYLVTIRSSNGQASLSTEFYIYGLVIPTMLRNFQIDEQPSSSFKLDEQPVLTFKLDGQPVLTFENGFHGVSTPHTLHDDPDERGAFIEVELQEELEDSRTLRRVKVHGVGVSTVLPTDWQQTSPGVFEYVDAAGEKSSLTFEKRPLSEVSFKADTISIKLLPRYAGRDWEGFLLQSGQGSSLKLITEEDNSTYLVTVEGGEEQASLSVESYLDGLIPTMLRKFKLDEP